MAMKCNNCGKVLTKGEEDRYYRSQLSRLQIPAKCYVCTGIEIAEAKKRFEKKVMN